MTLACTGTGSAKSTRCHPLLVSFRDLADVSLVRSVVQRLTMCLPVFRHPS